MYPGVSAGGCHRRPQILRRLGSRLLLSYCLPTHQLTHLREANHDHLITPRPKTPRNLDYGAKGDRPSPCTRRPPHTPPHTDIGEGGMGGGGWRARGGLASGVLEIVTTSGHGDVTRARD